MHLKLLVLCFFFPLTSHAYLDPGTASMILQVVIGGIVGGLMFFKTGWYKIKNLVLRVLGKKKSVKVVSNDSEN